jgi:hypothetical protein
MCGLRDDTRRRETTIVLISVYRFRSGNCFAFEQLLASKKEIVLPYKVRIDSFSETVV